MPKFVALCKGKANADGIWVLNLMGSTPTRCAPGQFEHNRRRRIQPCACDASANHVQGIRNVSDALREGVTSKPIKLLRRRIPISLTHTTAHDGGGIKLDWSNPFQPRQMVPAANLYPITPQ